ncbi:amidohydrolase [Clostridium nigeriense]|uniref:amidohydrolase n=1 Tax=Clostridium nigeriense TaxID=1805470 RepID=UPI00082A6EDF|nr:amidohydrolase [Clostridium nigeriense]
MNKQKVLLENVLLEDGFIYDKNIVIGTKTKSKDILICNEKIEGIYEKNTFKEKIEKIDMKGMLAVPSFKDRHIHLDKGYYGGKWSACTPFTSVFDRIKEEEEFLPNFLDDTEVKAKRLLDLLIENGVTETRVQCNVDPIIGLGNMERVIRALEDYKDKVNYEMVAFPQHGLLRSNSISYMKDAMRNGANIVGGLDPATIDDNINKSIDEMMNIAVEFNSDIDIHLHERGTLGAYVIKRLLKVVEEAKWQNRVTISHGYCLGDLEQNDLADICESMKELGVELSTTSPIDVACPPVPFISDYGVKVNIINDNINDHWSPFGSGDLLQRLSRMCEKFGVIEEYNLNKYLKLITNGVSILDKDGKVLWPKADDKADIVFCDASCSAEAIARISKRNALMKDGRFIFKNI